MRGLIKNNLYAAGFSAKWLFIFLAAAQLLVVILGKTALLIFCSVFCIVSFALNTIACYSKENASKWNTYKLTMPVTRRQIVKSKFVSHLLWMLFSVIMVGACMGLTFLFNGFIFEVSTDIFSVFTMGISLSFLLGAFFYPLHFLGGDENNELNLGISIVGAVGILILLIYLINMFFGFKKIETWQFFLSMLTVLVVSVLLFIIAYLLSVLVYNKKEC